MFVCAQAGSKGTTAGEHRGHFGDFGLDLRDELHELFVIRVLLHGCRAAVAHLLHGLCQHTQLRRARGYTQLLRPAFDAPRSVA
jgi:hypothetical protein